MIPKEGRVSHISFEQDKKQAARRYYDLRTTIIDSMRDYTNIITIASQPPAWFFSPKELTQTLRICLHEINFCDNSFIQESFMTNSDIAEIKLRHHEFLKHRDHQKWLFTTSLSVPNNVFGSNLSTMNVRSGKFDTMMNLLFVHLNEHLCLSPSHLLQSHKSLTIMIVVTSRKRTVVLVLPCDPLIPPLLQPV